MAQIAVQETIESASLTPAEVREAEWPAAARLAAAERKLQAFLEANKGVTSYEDDWIIMRTWPPRQYWYKLRAMDCTPCACAPIIPA